MTENRSVPADTVLPHVVYQNVGAAIDWLSTVFGFTEHYRYGDPERPSGAHVYLNNASVMLRTARTGDKSPAQLGYGTQSLTVFVEDVDTHFERSNIAGATILEEPHVTEYGEYQYAAQDLDGHHWLFSKHARDVEPAEWGARVASESFPRPQSR